jgi:hypothetical protein
LIPARTPGRHGAEYDSAVWSAKFGKLGFVYVCPTESFDADSLAGTLIEYAYEHAMRQKTLHFPLRPQKKLVAPIYCG